MSRGGSELSTIDKASTQIAGYIGDSDSFDRALEAFAFAYSEQNEADWKAFKKAIKEKRIPVAGE